MKQFADIPNVPAACLRRIERAAEQCTGGVESPAGKALLTAAKENLIRLHAKCLTGAPLDAFFTETYQIERPILQVLLMSVGLVADENDVFRMDALDLRQRDPLQYAEDTFQKAAELLGFMELQRVISIEYQRDGVIPVTGAGLAVMGALFV